MKLVSWNVNGLRAAWKKGFLDFLVAERPDAMCVQETRMRAEQITDEIRTPAGYGSHWNAGERKGYSGVVTDTATAPLAAGTAFGSRWLDVEGRSVHTQHADFHL